MLLIRFALVASRVFLDFRLLLLLAFLLVDEVILYLVQLLTKRFRLLRKPFERVVVEPLHQILVEDPQLLLKVLISLFLFGLLLLCVIRI